VELGGGCFRLSIVSHSKILTEESKMESEPTMASFIGNWDMFCDECVFGDIIVSTFVSRVGVLRGVNGILKARKWASCQSSQLDVISPVLYWEGTVRVPSQRLSGSAAIRSVA
jgi:hypothetical protein